MSTDRTAEMLNYLSAISREVGELRKEMGELRNEMNARFTEVGTRLDRIERELRQHTKRLDRIESMALAARADVDDLDERVRRSKENMLRFAEC
jgi:chromosome segregation ATPase